MVRVIACMLVLTGCTTYDLASQEKIIRPRVIAMRLEPPDAVIGQTVRAIPLVATPVGDDEVLDHYWIDCPREEGAVSGVGPAGENQDWCSDREAEELMGTGNELVYTVDDVPADEVAALAFNGGYWRRLSLEVVGRESGERDRAFKRLVVYPEPTDPQSAMLFEAIRNRNPDLPELEVMRLADGELTPLADDAPFEANTDYLFRFAIDARHRQDYSVMVIDLNGIDPSQAQNLTREQVEERLSVEDRREVMTMRYYLTDGKWGAQQLPNRTLETKELPNEQAAYYPAEITWALNTDGRSEAIPSRVKLWFIVMDGRGGMAWTTLNKPFVQGSAEPRSALAGPEPPPSVADSARGRR